MILVKQAIKRKNGCESDISHEEYYMDKQKPTHYRKNKEKKGIKTTWRRAIVNGLPRL